MYNNCLFFINIKKLNIDKTLKMKHITFLVICCLLFNSILSTHSKLRAQVNSKAKSTSKSKNDSYNTFSNFMVPGFAGSSELSEMKEMHLDPPENFSNRKSSSVEGNIDQYYGNSDLVENESDHFTTENENTLEANTELSSKIRTNNLEFKGFSKGDTDVKLSNWLTISSVEFRNQKKFPVLVTQENGQQEISIAREHFQRLNMFNFSLLKDKQKPPKVNIFHLPEKKLKGVKQVLDPESKKDYFWFWFRASDRYMYYSSNPEVINQLGSFNLQSISHVAKTKNKRCFDVQERTGSEFRICALNEAIKTKWFCHIQVIKKIKPLDGICTQGGEFTNQFVKKTIIQPILMIPTPSRQCNDKWNYANHGRDWECKCSEGKFIL